MPQNLARGWLFLRAELGCYTGACIPGPELPGTICPFCAGTFHISTCSALMLIPDTGAEQEVSRKSKQNGKMNMSGPKIPFFLQA